MEREYYTVEQISKMLSIHTKTVQRYIREGRLHATKIGKSWRVSGHDLSIFTGENEDVFTKASDIVNEDSVKASAVVDVKVSYKEEANRLINTLMATMNVKPPEYGKSSLHAQFLENESIVRFTLWGNIQFMVATLSSIEVFIDQKKEENRNE